MPADRAPSVLITGIHSDHGFAISHRFRKEGWFVVGCDQGSHVGRNARAHITADLTDEADCRRAAAHAAMLGNGIDCIVNCADVRVDGPVEEFGSQAWDVMMDVNVKSVFLLATASMPYLEEMHGSIVAVAPGLDITPGAEHAVHDATRAAVIALMSSLTSELAGHGIHVHVVLPDHDGRILDADAVADRVWQAAGFDSEGHELSFAHAH
ncbi:MAG: SDR family NAD(P)-dependent oxidoreductase [Actinomycetales bacterium]|nr:SDR family NAD(P)-dependent oxidoreductase [Actinomycetales bacterium]